MSRETLTFMVDQIEKNGEHWKAEYRKAMDCRDLEDLLQRGMGHFWMIRLADESWTGLVQSGKVPFDADVARRFRAKYEWWLKPCDEILNRLDLLQREFKVDYADQFRDCVRMALRAVSFDIDDLVESFDDSEKGKMTPFPAVASEAGHATLRG